MLRGAAHPIDLSVRDLASGTAPLVRHDITIATALACNTGCYNAGL